MVMSCGWSIPEDFKMKMNTMNKWITFDRLEKESKEIKKYEIQSQKHFVVQIGYMFYFYMK